jgi:hypothetical protein
MENELELLREQARAGMHPREMVIESYRREWETDPESAEARLAEWKGTPTGDNIEEGRRRAKES